jgi:hypothetical protein
MEINMKKIIGLIVLMAVLMSGIMVIAKDSKTWNSKALGRYMACDNPRGGGFFWVDTTSGTIWRAEYRAPKTIWVYIGQINNGRVEKIGTYIPQANRNGSGLYILNTVTGEGWYITGSKWTKGKKYKSIGKPEYLEKKN